MLRFLSPGDIIADLVGLPKDGDNRLVFRMFLNTLIWGAIGSAAVFLIMR